MSGSSIAKRPGGSAVDSLGPLLSARSAVISGATISNANAGRARREPPQQEQRERGGTDPARRLGERRKRVVQMPGMERDGDRGGEPRRDKRERNADVPAPHRGRGAARNAMHQIAAEDRGNAADQERGIGRTAERVHARQQIEDDAIGRRIAAERIDDERGKRDREEADLARPCKAARNAENEDRQHGKRAGIDLTHVRREEKLLRVPATRCTGPSTAPRSPD